MSKRTFNCRICGKPKDGKHSSYCKSCDAIKSKEYQKNNKLKVIAKRKVRYQSNKDAYKQSAQKLYIKNQEKILKKAKEYYNSLTLEEKKHKYKLQNDLERKKRGELIFKDRVRDEAQNKINIPEDTCCFICNHNLARERHHPDYSKPLEVILVCRECHMKLHRKINPLLLKEERL